MLSDEEQSINPGSATVDALHLKELEEKGIHADVLRLDKIHPVISGNKWFKLRYYLEETLKNNSKQILTFGGAYSNHIVAAACAAKSIGIKSTGIIRGEQPATLSHTLQHAKSYGMQLEFISRGDYKKRNEASFKEMLSERFAGAFIIPEGGAGANGIKGSAEIRSLFNSDDYSHILCAVGTGTMFGGLANTSPPNQKITGICVLKGMHAGYEELIGRNKSHQEINHDYHFGGYAKKTDVLIRFMNAFYEQAHVPTDFVYTGKLFYAAIDLVKKNHFHPSSRLLIIHSGGLQGNASLKPGTLIF